VSTGAPRPYVVLARKYRPRAFDDLIGQQAMVTTLENAFATDRIAQAYMLTGVRGVGKTTTARILARALNYATEGGEDRPTIDMPGLGRHCAEIIDSRHPDVIEMDAASNTGIDNIREIIESARYKPLVARYKVFIIDEVHMLSKGAFNALLKTLEEPPGHVKFIFATTEVRKVPVTVLSRCQRFDLRRVDVPELTRHFERIAKEEGATAEPEALALIARAAEGSVRDGLSILDQAIAMGAGTVTTGAVRAMLGLADRGRVFDLAEHVFRGDAAAALKSFGALHHDGADPTQVLSDLADAVHIAARAKAVGTDAAGEELSAEERRRAGTLAENLSVPLLSRAWQMLLKGIEESAKAPNAQAAAEMVLIRIAHTADLPAPDEIIRALGGRSHQHQPGAGGPPAGRDAPSPRQPLNQAPGQPAARPRPAAQSELEPPPHPGHAALRDDAADEDRFFDADYVGEADEAPAAPTSAQRPDPRSFQEVVDLVGERRDARLKVHLEDNVSLVKFDAAGTIDIFLLPAAPPEIANDLREKLNAWTRRRWMVAVSKTRGETPLGEARRRREAAELEQLKAHPAVKAVLDEFPGARIASVSPLKVTREDETGTG